MVSKKIITSVTIAIKTEFVEQLLPVAKATREKILQEEGCETFILNKKIKEPGTLVLLAIYKSEQAYNWHNEQAYVKEFFASLDGKLLGAPIVDYLEEL